MKCFEVTINGKRICIAGIGDDGVLTTVLSFVKRNTVSGPSSDIGSETKTILDTQVSHRRDMKQPFAAIAVRASDRLSEINRAKPTESRIEPSLK
jgi:hypothetical protein